MAGTPDDPPEEGSAGQSRTTIIRNRNGWWTARDESLEVTVQGTTRENALENLADLVAALDDVEIGVGDESSGSR